MGLGHMTLVGYLIDVVGREQLQLLLLEHNSLNSGRQSEGSPTGSRGV
jgi:hypothetical protein